MSYKKQRNVLILISITALWFLVVLTNTAFRRVMNDIDIFVVSEDGRPSDLKRTKSNSGVTYSLTKSANGEDIMSSDGNRIPVSPGALMGHVEVLRPAKNYLYISGWAFDAKNSRLPDVILVSHIGKIIYWKRNNHSRPDVAKVHGKAALYSGFRYLLPLNLFKDPYNPQVRLFAISNAVASELRYFEGHQVLDCSRGQGKCLVTEIEFNIKDCRSRDPTGCKKTKEGLKEVSLIADPGNYISAPFTDQEFTVELVNDELSRPWDLEFLTDGSMLVTEQRGKIIHIKRDGKKKVYELETISDSESGLMGLAIDPNFSKNNYVYIYYTYKFYDSDPSFLNPKPGWKPRVLNKISRLTLNKISRLTFKNGLLRDETVLIDKIPGSRRHSGSRLDFGPDGKLYVTTGDAEDRLLAQDISFLGGKILRLNPDGSIPDDNPFPNNYTYSMGHRNPQGLAWHPVTNELYESEHGPTRYDEINHIRPGQNYGWGSFKCDEKNSDIPAQGNVIFPIICFKKFTMAPSGMDFVSDPESPWFGSLFVASLRGKHLHRYVFDNDKIIKDEIFFVAEGKEYINDSVKGKISLRIRDVEFHNGSLYVIGDSFGLVKITPKEPI